MTVRMKIGVRPSSGKYLPIHGDSLRVYIETDALAQDILEEDEGYCCHFNFTPEGMIIDMVGDTTGEVYRTFSMMWDEIAFELCRGVDNG